MNETFIMMGSRYECNIFQDGPGMTVTLSMYLEYWALQSYLDPIFTSVTIILCPYRKTLHSYLDPFVLDVTLISGPLKNLCYTHTVTPSWKMLHSYLDPIIINVSFIPGPPLYIHVRISGQVQCPFQIYKLKITHFRWEALFTWIDEKLFTRVEPILLPLLCYLFEVEQNFQCS